MELSTRWNIVPGDTLADKLTVLEESGYEYIDLSGPALEVSPQIHHLKKCKTSLEPAVKAGYDDL